MDIAKYIGLYLLKNRFCYLHGLGNLQIHKKPPVQNGDTLSAPTYEISLQTTGSIDDNLANFIATAEQTSIAKASTEIRSFVENARAEMAAGTPVIIPGVGNFTSQNGKTVFVADPAFSYSPAAVPTLRMSKRLEDTPSFKRATPEEDALTASNNGPNIQKILLIVLAVAAVIGIIVLAVKYLTAPTKQVPIEEAPQVITAPAPDTMSVAAPLVGDSMAPSSIPTTTTTTTTTTSNPALPATGAQIVLRSYSTQAAAEKRQRQLKTTPLGETVSVLMQDSSNYLVVVPYAGPLSDSTRVLDSLSRVYGSRATLRR